MTGLRSLRSLPAVAWWVLLLTTGNSVGTGLILPLLVLYMHSVRHLEYSVATGVVVAASVGAAISAPIVGALSDHIGRLPAIAGSMVVAGVGSLGYAITDSAWKALLFGLVMGLGLGGAAIMNALIADLVPAEHWSTVFGLNLLTSPSSTG
jgi:MFS family permease